MRESGFYWCLFAEEWEVCHWLNDQWWSSGCDFSIIPREIDERRIIRAA